MNLAFRPMFTAEVAHDYYGGPCGDLEFVTPAATARALAALRLLARVRDGRLYVLYEADDAGNPPGATAGATLDFGLRPADPSFVNVTDPVTTGAGQRPLYANTADPAKLDAPKGVRMAGGLYRYTPRTAARPLTVRLLDGGGTPLEARALTPGDPAVLFDLRARPDGPYTIDEDPGGGPVASTDLYVGEELLGLGAWGVLRVAVAAGFPAEPPAFVIALRAVSQTLKYYVVAENYSQAEFDALDVVDGGSARESRAAIPFVKVLPAAFGAGDLPPALLGAPPARLVLFRSQDPVPRRARGYGMLQLNRNGDALVDNLPLPRPGRPTSDLVVRVSKPT